MKYSPIYPHLVLPLKKQYTMSNTNVKQFGVWMDSHHATILGRESVDSGDFIVLGHVKSANTNKNSSESASNNQEIGLTNKFFKEIAAKMVNVEEVHITGTGQIQEQFIKFLAETPQFKDTTSSDSTSNKMSDGQLIAFISKHFN